MTLNWDFTNYTFSFLISLLSAILGICHPLLLESIRKIDEQYGSSILSARFQKESVFKWFQSLMIVCLCISFVVPFLMLLFDSHVLNICAVTVQSIVFLFLVLVLLSMFRLIQTYYNPENLAGLLFGGRDPMQPVSDGNLLYCAADLMRYSCYHPNGKAYERSKEFILSAAYAEQMPKDRVAYQLSDDVNGVIRLLTDYSVDERCKPLCYDNILQQVYINEFAKGFHGDMNFRNMWHCLVKMMDSDNTEWFLQYWEGAVQYYTFGIKRVPFETSKKKEFIVYDQRLLEFHRVLGGMLVYHEKYDWLHFILTYDHVQPPHFYLIPGTFSSIIDFVYGVELQTQRCMSLTAKYQMKGLFHNVNSDEVIVDLCFKYAALLVVRLFTYNDYNIGYCNPLEYPSVRTDETVSDLKKLKDIVTRIRHQVINYWYAKDRIKDVRLPFTPELNDVTSYIDEFVSKLNDRIHFRIENPELDKAKFDELKGLLVSIDNKAERAIDAPTETERNNWQNSQILIHIEQQLLQDICSTDGYNGWSNIPEDLYSLLQRKISAYFDGLLSFMTPAKDFLISEKHVFPAFEKLDISNNYVILSMGVYLGGIDIRYNTRPQLHYDLDSNNCSYRGIHVIERNSGMGAIYIIEKEGLHKMEYVQDDVKFSERKMVELTDSANHLYSNIDDIIASGNVNPVIKLGKMIRVYQNDNAKFIRIRVKPDVDDSFELANMLHLSDYMK